MVIHADRPSPSAREDEALLRGISDLGEGLVVVQGGHVLDANEAFCRIAGRSHAELTALGSLVEIVEPAARPELADLLRRSEAGVGAEDRFRGRLRRPDGSDVHVDVAVKSIDESGEDRRLVVLVRDATAQLRLETELRAQKLVLEAQTEASLDGILVISAEGEVAFANRRFAELWRIPEETIASASEAAVQAAIRERLADPDPFFARVSHLETHPAEDDRGELRLLDGRTFDRYTAPISDEAGRLHGRVWFFRDVTREHRRAAGSALLADASKLLAGSLEYETIATRIAEFIVPRLADWCAVDVVGDDGLFHRIGAAHADAARVRILEELDRRFPIRANEGHLRGRVVATGEPIAMFDVDELQLRSISRNEEHHELLAELGIRSAIWVPLAARGRVLGVMSFGLMSESRRFGETELALGEELGRRAALSLDNALVYRRLRDREQQQAVVAALGQAALTMSQLEELLDEAARRVAATLGVEFSKILELLPDRAGLRLVAGVGWRPGLVGSTILGVDRRSQAGYTLMSRSAVIVEDIAAETRFAEPSLLAEHGIVSGMSVIIDGPDGPWGVFAVHSGTRRRFTNDDVNFLQAVAHVVAGTIRRRHDEQLVRLRDDRLELTLAASKTGTWEWDIRSGRLDWSDAICRLHGLPPGVVPRDLVAYQELIHPEDRARFRDEVERTVAEVGQFDHEFRIVWPDGSVHWTNGVARVFRDENGDPTRMIGIGRDITDRKLAELERDRLLAQEREARALREAFIGVVSHELRTPITTIYGGVKLLSRKHGRGEAPANGAGTEAGESAASVLDERREGVLEDVEAEADRLYRIVEDLLVLTRVEQGRLEAADEPVHLGHLVRRAVRAEQARWPHVRITLRPARGLPVVRGDPTFVEQVLRNMLSNAAKYSPADSRVRVVLEGAGDEALVRVLDEGHGLAPDELPHLFQLFYRSPRTARTASGAGIGLYVARRLIEAMDGRIWATPREGRGSEFGFALRRYPTEEE